MKIGGHDQDWLLEVHRAARAAREAVERLEAAPARVRNPATAAVIVCSAGHKLATVYRSRDGLLVRIAGELPRDVSPDEPPSFEEMQTQMGEKLTARRYKTILGALQSAEWERVPPFFLKSESHVGSWRVACRCRRSTSKLTAAMIGQAVDDARSRVPLADLGVS